MMEGEGVDFGDSVPAGSPGAGQSVQGEHFGELGAFAIFIRSSPF